MSRWFLVLFLISPWNLPARADKKEELFERSIRPVLVTHCLKCHGPDKQQSGLRLDSLEGARKGGERGPALVPGKPEESLLLSAIRQDGGLEMPPGEKLPEETISLIEAWIRDGATWPVSNIKSGPTDPAMVEHLRKSHWAFRPIQNPELPPVEDPDWGHNPIDRFVLDRLQKAGLGPSATADKRTLLRRATFDLIGLPPTPEEMSEFLSDDSPEAFEKVVDRLLSSPHYGERWGRYWLDIARYADNKGYVFFQDNSYPWAYTYRDYVIESYNQDLPINQFILEQLAADRLDLGESKRPLRAMGFITLGGRFMNNNYDIIDDRIDVVSRGLLGLTVTCARCHDHKYDPVPQADYYALYGIFDNSLEPEVPPLFEPPPETAEYKTFSAELDKREQALTAFVREHFDALVASSKSRVAEYLMSAEELRLKPRTDQFMVLAEGNELNPMMITRWLALIEKSRKIEFDPIFGPWNALANLSKEQFAAEAPERLKNLLEADHDKINPILRDALAGQTFTSMQDLANLYAKVFLNVEKEWSELVTLVQNLEGKRPEGLNDPASEALRMVFHGPDAPPNLAFDPYGDLELFPDRARQGRLQELRKEIESYRASGAGAPPRAMVLVDRTQIVEPRIFGRGNPRQLLDFVPRQEPLILRESNTKPFQNGSGRLDLARAIVDPRNPLTARVYVNRIWLQHFGEGLVRTPSDFGVRSDPPSHPELLDHLASRFIEEGWSTKKLHRSILLSRTWQQSSSERSDGLSKDPENRLLWRYSPRRLDFEGQRDTWLAVSGQLDRTIGGASSELSGDQPTQRRTIYGKIDRLSPPGLLRTFDFPSPDATSPQRTPTTVAPQSLYLMNHPWLMKLAGDFSKRPELGNESVPERLVERLYDFAYQRKPTDEELQRAVQFVSGKPERWARLAHALLMSNELVFIE